jgi:hypothetical protein
MPDDAKLMPPIGEINTRLTALAREQKRLRTLLALAVEAKADAKDFSTAPAPADTAPPTAAQ